jgi:hypothetical protein
MFHDHRKHLIGPQLLQKRCGRIASFYLFRNRLARLETPPERPIRVSAKNGATIPRL